LPQKRAFVKQSRRMLHNRRSLAGDAPTDNTIQT
jgi:hypothetical protein